MGVVLNPMGVDECFNAGSRGSISDLKEHSSRHLASSSSRETKDVLMMNFSVAGHPRNLLILFVRNSLKSPSIVPISEAKRYAKVSTTADAKFVTSVIAPARSSMCVIFASLMVWHVVVSTHVRGIGFDEAPMVICVLQLG